MWSTTLLKVILLLSPVLARPEVSSTVYIEGLISNLTATGLTSFINALSVANTTRSGQQLINALYSDGSFTIYAPTNSAWEARAQLSMDQLVPLLAYHITTATINSTTDVADPRQHTVALTALRTDDILLPGDQTQVIVLETSPNSTQEGQKSILIRGDQWNATSAGDQAIYENLFIQPINRVLTVPSPLLKTLSTPYLALSAMNGTVQFLNLASSLNLSQTLQTCHGCTFFVPVDAALSSVQEVLNGLNESQKSAVLQTHVLNGTIAYSPRINPGATFTTATGQTLAYARNDTGNYLTIGNTAAKILRADIPVSNGVVHLIDSVFISTTINEQRAKEAVSSASNAATAPLGGVTGTIGLANATSTVSAASTGPTGGAETKWDYYAATNFVVLAGLLGSIWF